MPEETARPATGGSRPGLRDFRGQRESKASISKNLDLAQAPRRERRHLPPPRSRIAPAVPTHCARNRRLDREATVSVIDLADVRFLRAVERLHDLGPRALIEFLA